MLYGGQGRWYCLHAIHPHVIHKYEIVGSIWVRYGRKFMSVKCRNKKRKKMRSTDLKILKTQSTLLLMKLTIAWSTQTWTHGISKGVTKEKHLGNRSQLISCKDWKNSREINNHSHDTVSVRHYLPQTTKKIALHNTRNPQISNMLLCQDAALLQRNKDLGFLQETTVFASFFF